jgi:hypothetical protein
MVLGSRSIAVHLARGILGAGFLAAALQYASIWGWWAMLPALAALVCFRGCPMCWTIGLVETIVDGGKTGGKAGCIDGSCSLTGPPKLVPPDR